MTVGDKLRELRKGKGMTQQQLAEKIGLKKSAISMYETNKNIPPTLNLMNIASALNVDVMLFIQTLDQQKNKSDKSVQ